MATVVGRIFSVSYLIAPSVSVTDIVALTL